jgi:hypothetical protein
MRGACGVFIGWGRLGACGANGADGAFIIAGHCGRKGDEDCKAASDTGSPHFVQKVIFGWSSAPHFLQFAID